MIRIGVDIGGVISKYPDIFRRLFAACAGAPAIQLFVVSDIHDHAKTIRTLRANGFDVPPERVISADYKQHAELCKTRVCEALGLDVLIDDFVGYVASGPHLRLLVMPDPHEPYYHDDWKTDGPEGDFGRRRKA